MKSDIGTYMMTTSSTKLKSNNTYVFIVATIDSVATISLFAIIAVAVGSASVVVVFLALAIYCTKKKVKN